MRQTLMRLSLRFAIAPIELMRGPLRPFYQSDHPESSNAITLVNSQSANRNTAHLWNRVFFYKDP